MAATKFTLAIPTLNAEKHLDAFLAGLDLQRRRPDRMLVVDSSSDDGTVDRLRSYGAEVLVIDRADFDHGGTRQLMVERCANDDVVVFMTQDAICADDSTLANIIAAVEDPGVGAVCGRQLPHEGAGPIEAHARMFNYAADSRRVADADVARLGIRAVFMSNSFAAYRLDALRAIGGFPLRTIMNEDMYVAARMIAAGWSVAYAGDARVHHSHAYRITEECRRYFDIGVFFAHNPWLVEKFGGAGGEGRKYVVSELRWLARQKPAAIPGSILRNAMKLVGMELGRRYTRLPLRVSRSLSAQKSFWREP